MPRIEHQESEEVEFKREWTDRALEDLAAFAHTQGGTLYVGVGDDGTVIGVPASDAEIQRIANTVTSQLGITPSIRVEQRDRLQVITVGVEPVRGLVPYRGRYLRRVGSTNRDFTPEELARHILERSGRTWDTLPSPWGFDQIKPEAVAHFARLARGRLPHIDPAQPELILRNQELVQDGRLTHGGALLFATNPQMLFPQARVRIGLFRGPSEILDTHEFAGTLWDQLDGAMERFRQVLKVRFQVRVTEPSLEGLQRQDIWEYPLEALREAAINALIHRDYTVPADIQIRLYDDRLEIWNAGGLPSPLRPEDLRTAHMSVLRNPLLARAFYFAGLIEQWGTGTTRIIDLCRAQDLPEPEFEVRQGGLRVVFLKDPYTPERLRAMGLNERQVQAVLYVKTHGSIGNKEYQRLTGAKERTATSELGDLVEKGVLERIGATGRGTRYAARKAQMAQ